MQFKTAMINAAARKMGMAPDTLREFTIQGQIPFMRAIKKKGRDKYTFAIFPETTKRELGADVFDNLEEYDSVYDD